MKVASSVAMVPEGPESMTVSGGVVSTVKDLVAGVGSWFPAASSALKVAVWGPSERPVKVFGEVQSVKGSVSIRHWILAVSPGLAELNRKVASSVAMVPEGPESMTVSGAVVSTVKDLVAGVGSWFPAASSALKVAVWGPSERPVKDFGEVQSVKGSVSIRHWILAVSPGLAELNRKVASSVAMVPEGPESMTVSGAVVSTVKDLVAGVGSWFPAESMALTSKVWGPSVSAAIVSGLVQGEKASASTRHSKSAPGSEENSKLGVGSLVVPVGPESIVVSGGVGSKAQSS